MASAPQPDLSQLRLWRLGVKMNSCRRRLGTGGLPFDSGSRLTLSEGSIFAFTGG